MNPSARKNLILGVSERKGEVFSLYERISAISFSFDAGIKGFVYKYISDYCIIKKMKSVTNPEAKAKEWAKLVKNSGGEQKTLDPILLSDAPEFVKSKLIKCKTGDVISISSQIDPNNPKQPAKTVLFYVVKRGKIEGDLLGQAVASKIKENLEKKLNEHIMGQVKVEMLDKKGMPMKAATPDAPSAAS